MHPVRFFILMGVAGCGKSSYGRLLADRFQVPYIDGDDFHPPENIAKMSAGIALDDTDRWPWLDAIVTNMAKASRASGADGIIFAGCSSLRKCYRDHLLTGIGAPLHFIYLAADRALITQRMAARDGHFMPNSLIDSQFSTLEVPEDNEPASHIDINGSVDSVMSRILVAITPLISGNG